MKRRKVIGVIGASFGLSKEVEQVAEEVGKLIIESGFSLVCGGLSGVMEAACRGAKRAKSNNGGVTIGIIPSNKKEDSNPYVDLVIPTGMGLARNVIVVLASDAIIAINGGSGTLAELAFAWQYGKPIVAITKTGGWAEALGGQVLDNRRDDVILNAKDPAEAIKIIISKLKGSG